ncbi:hypothetical protein D3C83_225970 [compost metagenome]
MGDGFARKRADKKQHQSYKDGQFEQHGTKELPGESCDMHTHCDCQNEQRGNIRENSAAYDHRHCRMLGEAKAL